jgi:hypothetical protein
MMGMNDAPAKLQAAVDTQIIVEYRQFTLQVDHADAPLASQMSPGDQIMNAGAGGAIFRSGGTDHYPTIRMELWSTTPPATEPHHWDAIETGQITTPAPAPVYLRSILAVISPDYIRLPAAGRYHLRAHVRGREAANTLGEASFAHGIEHWHLQLWPHPLTATD